MTKITSHNPYDGSIIDSFKTHNQQETDAILNKANDRFYNWRETNFSQRKKLMLAAAAELKNNIDEYAEKMTLEIGKPISQSRAEVEKCAWVCEYYAENAAEHLSDTIIKTDAHKSFISFEPIGVVLAIMPWNYPFWQVFRFAAPALMAGNIGVLKHASNVFGSALNIEKVFKRAGFPDGCFSSLLVSSDKIERVIKNPIIKAVTLTGSGPAGAAVAKIAGEQIKKTVLELGGNNALIVLKDCNLQKTVDTCVHARFQNTGQSCIAGKRLLIQESIAEQFINALVKQVRELNSGDPRDENTYIGTMARKDLAKELQELVDKSITAGAKLEIGGKHNQAYFEPTILTNVTPDMPVFKEETFGPVLAITTFKTIDEAITLSNNSRFGLGVSIFTTAIEKAEKMAFKFDEGAVFINEMVKSDPKLPFGGVKESGYGRELSSEGIRAFVNKKTVYINK